MIPEYVARSWWERILYNQSARRLRTALLGRRHTVVVNVPYRREEPEPAPPLESRAGVTGRRLIAGPLTAVIGLSCSLHVTGDIRTRRL